MGLSIRVDNGEPRPVGTNRGWGDFCRLVGSLDVEDYDDLYQLCAYGVAEDLAEIAHELNKLMAVGEFPMRTRETADRLLAILGDAPDDAECVSIDDGTDDGDDAEA